MNNILRGNNKSTPAYLENEGEFFTKPSDIAKHLNDYFINKINNLKNTKSNTLINKMMDGKTCSFKFKSVSGSKVELLLMTCKNKPPGVDYLTT